MYWVSSAVSGPPQVFDHKQLFRQLFLAYTTLQLNFLRQPECDLPNKTLELWEQWGAKPDLPKFRNWGNSPKPTVLLFAQKQLQRQKKKHRQV